MEWFSNLYPKKNFKISKSHFRSSFIVLFRWFYNLQRIRQGLNSWTSIWRLKGWEGSQTRVHRRRWFYS